MKTVEPEVLYVAAIMVLITVVLWLAACSFVYLADNWASPARNERSLPAARTY